MAGWSQAKRRRVEGAFYEYLDNCYVFSKDHGQICLGEHLYEGQRRFITAVFDGLENDIHKFYVLKSRQLGLSTIVRALLIFWVGIHKGIRGALVFDTSPHKESARRELVSMIKNLPADLKFPIPTGATSAGNRDSLQLTNESTVLFMAAGVKKSKGSGTLGRSEGLSCAHLSELCSYDNEEGMKSFEQSLSEIHPDRLYIYESTARGFNMWETMWSDARADEHHCCCIFLGWWSKESQRIERDHPDWALYGDQPPSAKEAAKIKLVKEMYDFDVTQEQLAWIRRKVDPIAHSEGDAEADSETDDAVMLAEQAWTEDEAFQNTGAVFFGNQVLNDQTNNWVSRKFKTYMFMTGHEFADMRIWPAANAKSVELKVWEQPDPEGVYCLGIDPAYGENEENCRSSIQVLRCYADGVDQVAEYAWPLITTYQLAWVIAALLGWYGSDRAEVRYILELNGPGMAVWNELRALKHKIDTAPTPADQEKGLTNVFRNVRNYIYSRPDSMGAGYNYHFKTTTPLKVGLLERLRDFTSNGLLRIRSMDVIQEMQSIAREGDSIEAPPSKTDDRVIALALAVHCWEEKARRQLVAERRTREADRARRQKSIIDQVSLFNQNNLEQFFNAKKQQRNQEAKILERQRWRYGAGRRF